MYFVLSFKRTLILSIVWNSNLILREKLKINIKIIVPVTRTEEGFSNGESKSGLGRKHRASCVQKPEGPEENRQVGKPREGALISNRVSPRFREVKPRALRWGSSDLAISKAWGSVRTQFQTVKSLVALQKVQQPWGGGVSSADAPAWCCAAFAAACGVIPSRGTSLGFRFQPQAGENRRPLTGVSLSPWESQVSSSWQVQTLLSTDFYSSRSNQVFSL